MRHAFSIPVIALIILAFAIYSQSVRAGGPDLELGAPRLTKPGLVAQV
jgi:hypothetical protein